MFNSLEIRVLICKQDIDKGINMIKSLTKFEQFKNVPVYFHDDGSLDENCKNLLNDIQNCEIIDRKYADSTIIDFISKYNNCQKYRLGDNRINRWHKIKLFDFYFLSVSKNILCIDSDILFINKPKNVIKLIEESTPFYFPDFRNSYSFTKDTKVSMLDNVNTGLIYIPSEQYYNINLIENALNDLFSIGISNTPNWIEQSAYSHMFCEDGRYVKLDEGSYKIPTPHDNESKNLEALHFVNHPPVRSLYNGFLKTIEIL